MVIVVLILAAGYPIGGALGDRFFRRSPRGRLLVSTVGILLGILATTLVAFVVPLPGGGHVASFVPGSMGLLDTPLADGGLPALAP